MERECEAIPQWMQPTRTDIHGLGVSYSSYTGDEPLTDQLARFIVQLGVGLKAERISRAAFPWRYAEDITVTVELQDGTTTEMSLAEYMRLETNRDQDRSGPSQEQGAPSTPAQPHIPTGPITRTVADQQLALAVGQTLSFVDAVKMGNALYAGMTIGNIVTNQPQQRPHHPPRHP